MTDLQLLHQRVMRSMCNDATLVRIKLKHPVKELYSFVIVGGRMYDWELISGNYDQLFDSATEVRTMCNHTQLLEIGNAKLPYWVYIQC